MSVYLKSLMYFSCLDNTLLYGGQVEMLQNSGPCCVMRLLTLLAHYIIVTPPTDLY